MKIRLVFFLVFYTIIGQASEPLIMNVDAKSSQFVVTLPANPTTGYQWKVSQYDKRHFQMLSSHFIAPKTRLIGAGGQMTFTFAPIKGKSYPKSTTMLFTYARSWEPKSGTVKEVTINFRALK